jgi:amidohydrolase family protein
MAINVTSHARRRPYDLVVAGGRVVDPVNGVDGPVDVAVADGRVVEVSAASLRAEGRQVVHADGMDVLPGLVDVHTHCSSEFAGRVAQGMLVRAGVTTAVDLAGPVQDVMDLAVRHPAGLTLGCVQRLKPGENVGSSDPGRAEIRAAIVAGVRAGALGAKILGGHFPLTPAATAAAIQEAAAEAVWIAFHCGTTRTIGDFEGLAEALELRDEGAPLHVPHVNSYCRGRTDLPEREAQRVVELLEAAPGVFSESYLAEVNGTWGRCQDGRPESAATRRALDAGRYEPTETGLERAIGDGYALVHVAGETTVELVGGPDGIAYWRMRDTNVGVSFKVNHPLAAVLLACARRGDGTPGVTAFGSDGGGIPRNEILRWGYRLASMGLLSLADVVRKSSRVPAQYLGLPDKGHLGVGADADLVVAGRDGLVAATVGRGRLLFDGSALTPAPTTWLATERGAVSAKAAGLDVRVIDPFNEGLYGSS